MLKPHKRSLRQRRITLYTWSGDNMLVSMWFSVDSVQCFSNKPELTHGVMKESKAGSERFLILPKKCGGIVLTL